MQRKEIQTAGVPEEAQVIYEVDDTTGPMDTIMRFRFFIIGLLVVLGLVSAFPLRAVFSSRTPTPHPSQRLMTRKTTCSAWSLRRPAPRRPSLLSLTMSERLSPTSSWT
ncbi:hypothetical protein [Collinsella tanakaei]|uniref:hypothetical protein n=1 Tax=Collinsella tanakaei TaxID=626935 RepID=UPI0025A34659|nr:hypothetical protein [Collinsella tanakaei]MDM8302682.1 hypothetical protein [Collinsella tanakaei]